MDAYRAKLSWYLTHANNGRGRVTGFTAEALRRGHVERAWTSRHCWVITLSPSGRTFLQTDIS